MSGKVGSITAQVVDDNDKNSASLSKGDFYEYLGQHETGGENAVFCLVFVFFF